MSKGYRMGVGASSVLMIFVVLSLTTLGVLSFATARANHTLTDRRRAQVEQYYQSAAQAQRVLSEIDAALMEAAKDPETYEENVRALAVGGAALEVTEALMISFTVPVNERQELQVAVQANGPEAQARYTPRHHRVVNVADWTPEAPNLWDLV